MADLTHLFEIGQHVKYRNDDFDAVKKFIPCVVKETYPDHIIITDTETNTDLWCEEGLNMDCVFPDYEYKINELTEKDFANGKELQNGQQVANAVRKRRGR